MEASDISKIKNIQESNEVLNALFLATPESSWEIYEDMDYYHDGSKNYNFGENVAEKPRNMKYVAFAKIKGGKARFHFKTSNTNVTSVQNFHFWMGNHTFTLDPTVDSRIYAENIATKLFQQEIMDSVNKLIQKQNPSRWKFWRKSYEN